MDSRRKEEKIPMESKAYPGEFFFFVRVNELLHGLGSKYNIHLNYLDVHKPYAGRGLSQFAMYNNKCSSQSIPLPVVKSLDTSLAQSIADVTKQLEVEGNIAGAQICIIDRNGDHVVHYVHGHQGGLKRSLTMRPDALILGFSCTKAVAATLAHVLVEDGFLSYDEPICHRVWPAFCSTDEPPTDIHLALDLSKEVVNERWSWKRKITLRHILTHTCGLWSALPAKLTIKTMASCEQCVAAFEYNSSFPEDTLLPISAPGSKTEYHFMSFGWLVAGTVIGAYAQKNGIDPTKVTFEQVYTLILLPRLSKETIASGFCPCGGGGGTFPLAMVDVADIQLSRLIQMQREAESQGEWKNASSSDGSTQGIRESFRGKEFLLDSRIWNCQEGLRACCPAAGGRFTANGLASFYHDLANGKVLNRSTIAAALSVAISGNMANTLQGPTNFASSSTGDIEDRISMGMGYQAIEFSDSKGLKSVAFGHAGIGGSIGFHHSDSGVSVGIMLNKADADRSTVKRILEPISQHFGWQ